MASDLTITTIHRFPHGFINKRAEPALITPLTCNRHGQLLEMYLAFPRNSFSGLSPIRDEACQKWVLNMVADGVSLVAMRFDHEMVAHGALFALNENSCEMFMAVRQSDQNIGIGSEMARCLIQLGHELGFEQICLSVEAGNHPARHVYEKSGFRYLSRGMHDR